MDPTSQPPGEVSASSALEQRLLDAARQDQVPDALRARMAEGLGLHVAAATSSVSVGSGGKLGAPLFAKAGLWGALSVVLVAGVVGWRAAQHSVREDHGADVLDVRTANPSPSAIPIPIPIPILIPTPTPTPIPTPIPIANPIPAEARKPLEPTRPTPARSIARPDDADLRAEVALLDQARFALREGRGTRALQLVDQHRQRFTQARLAPEAAALRVEALVQQGAYAQAEAMAQQFAAAYPTHPLRERVTTLGRQGASQARKAPSPTR